MLHKIFKNFPQKTAKAVKMKSCHRCLHHSAIVGTMVANARDRVTWRKHPDTILSAILPGVGDIWKRSMRPVRERVLCSEGKQQRWNTLLTLPICLHRVYFALNCVNCACVFCFLLFIGTCSLSPSLCPSLIDISWAPSVSTDLKGNVGGGGGRQGDKGN